MLAHQGVDLKRRPPKSRPDRAAEPKQASVFGDGPQGLRRPRFSFFRFTCQTARNQGGPTLRRTGEPSKPAASDWDRKPGHRLSVRIRRHAVAPRRRRAELTQYIGFRPPQCQHPEGLGNGSEPASVRGLRGPAATAVFASNIGGLERVERPAGAVLGPHSSAPLVDAVGGVTSGGTASTSRDPRRTASPND